MLKMAIQYEEELIEASRKVWYEDKYKYYCTYWEDIKINENTWDQHQFVSVNSKGNIVGFISYNIDREASICYSFGAINFTDNITFGIDLGRAVKDIFEKFNFRKLRFSVFVGNPIEKSYDKIIKKYGGRIVGTYKDEARLMDGSYCDEKLYEIMRKDYMNRRSNV